jgi:HD-GYP domain-containing protein (c-di-GMP phosphodiesterase class II)
MKISPTKTVSELITVLSYIIDIEKGRNVYHAWRVAMLAARIAKGLLSSRGLKDVFYAGLLHDAAGVEFSHHIIHYLKRHDKASRNLLLSHPIIAAQLISNIPKMGNAAKFILDHHEWINGSGYPRAKTQDDIPLGSQILRIADSIDIAIQTSHPPGLSELKTALAQNCGKEYSQRLFKRALDILKKDSFFYRLRLRKNVPQLFKEIKENVGAISMPGKIDAIGTALEVFAQIIDMKHPYTSGHSHRVSRYAIACGLAMNLGHDEITRIKWSGLIHDIGKLGVSRRVLDKPGALTPKEYEEVKTHAALTRKIMDMIPSLQDITPIASSHHEHFDGSGYPLGLKGDQIPFGARILVVCDAFDAMISNRPYRNPLSPQAACEEIKRNSGTQFDPEIVEVAIPLFKNLGL